MKISIQVPLAKSKPKVNVKRKGTHKMKTQICLLEPNFVHLILREPRKPTSFDKIGEC